MTHAFCFFCSIGRRVRWGTSIALAPKKNFTLQARLGPPPDVAPILGESRASVIALSAGLASPAVVPMPSVGRVVDEAKGAPSEVAAHLAMEVNPLPTSERAELSAAPVLSTMAGVAQPDEVLPMEVEVMVATMDGL